MSCDAVQLPNGGQAIVCTGRPRANTKICPFCRKRKATRYCDGPGSTASKTCDALLCEGCAVRDGERDLCPRHAQPARPTLYAPPDADRAHEEWGASCGPAALGALLGRPVQSIRSYFPEVRRGRSWVNPTQMEAALDAAGLARWDVKGRPTKGLVFVQFKGSWDSAPVAEQYRHTHWIAAQGDGSAGGTEVYDVNAGTAGEWLPLARWRAEVAPVVGQSQVGGTGEWFVRRAIETAEKGAGASHRVWAAGSTQRAGMVMVSAVPRLEPCPKCGGWRSVGSRYHSPRVGGPSCDRCGKPRHLDCALDPIPCYSCEGGG